MADLDLATSSDGYISRHWNGRLSLTKSFWLNLIVPSIAFAILLSVLAAASGDDAGGTLRLVYFLTLALSFLAWLWGATGVWRSADRYSKQTGAGVWGNVASAIVVLQGLSWLVQGPGIFR